MDKFLLSFVPEKCQTPKLQLFLDAKTAPKLELMDIEGGFLVEEEERLLKSALADSYNMTRIVSNER